MAINPSQIDLEQKIFLSRLMVIAKLTTGSLGIFAQVASLLKPQK